MNTPEGFFTLFCCLNLAHLQMLLSHDALKIIALIFLHIFASRISPFVFRFCIQLWILVLFYFLTLFVTFIWISLSVSEKVEVPEVPDETCFFPALELNS